MNAWLSAILLTLLPSLVFAQEENYTPPPKLPAKAAAIEAINAKGWKVIQAEVGDLNKDNRPDLALVLEGPPYAGQVAEEGDEFADRPRFLTIYFKDSAGGYRHIVSETSLMMGSREGIPGQDPLEELGISRGVLSIRQSTGGMGRFRTLSYETHKFRYQNGGFYLIGYTITLDTKNGQDEPVQSTTDANLMTGVVEEDGKRWQGKKKPLVRLEKLRVGADFMPARGN